MKNPIPNPATLAEKNLTAVSGFWYPMVVAGYDEQNDQFLISADTDFAEEGRDTAFYDLDDFAIPACAIFAITGGDSDYEDPHDWVGHKFLMPGASVK